MSASKFGQGVQSRLLYQSPTVGVVAQSAIIDLEDFDVASVQLIVESGTLTGAWTLDVSNDYAKANWGGQNDTPGHWTPIVPAASGTPAYPALVAVTAPYPAASGNQYINLAGLGARALRITFTPATNTGVISIFAFAKSSN